jgi:hypothetical protein
MSGLTDADIARMRDQLFFEGPERNRRLSRYWLLLPLAAVIASAGVVSDSTATVIGAMIVAPLMTPILGIVLAVVLVIGQLLTGMHGDFCPGPEAGPLGDEPVPGNPVPSLIYRSHDGIRPAGASDREPEPPMAGKLDVGSSMSADMPSAAVGTEWAFRPHRPTAARQGRCHTPCYAPDFPGRAACALARPAGRGRWSRPGWATLICRPVSS